MKIQNNKIVEITQAELFKLYLKREIDVVMLFDEYKQLFDASDSEELVALGWKIEELLKKARGER